MLMQARPAEAGVVALLDVDNTLLDNDAFSSDLDAELRRALGEDGRARYREAYEALRRERGFADYLAPLQLLRRDFEDDPDLLRLSGFILDYPFADRVYPGAAEALRHLDGFATTAILSDGDIVFQPRKIARSGLAGAVGGRVLVTLDKSRELATVQRRLPARHYVLVDDKPREFYEGDREEQKFWQTVRARPGASVRDVRARFRDIDRRIADVEAHVTSHNSALAREIDALR